MQTRTCSKCGAALTDDLLGGLCPACLAAGALAPQAGERIRYFGDYELLEEIARGGMGVVYRARQLSLNRVVAVKMILAGQMARAEDVQRFRTEAEAAASLQHPNIVTIHEVGEHNGQQYFSMDLIEGCNLAELARTAPLAPRQAAEYLRIIAEAIHYAHQKGTLHRDLKPSNVLIDPLDQPRVTDFGLAKRARGDSELTATGQVLGTPNFMSPEQAAGRRDKVGPASDVYSLGAILYFVLTTRPPFEGETMQEVLMKVSAREPVGLRALNSAVPRDLETICLKCLEKEPARRYASAQELAGDLKRFLRDEPILARPVTRVEKTWRWCRRHRVVTALALALGIAVVGLLLREGHFRSALADPYSALLPPRENPSAFTVSSCGPVLNSGLNKIYVWVGDKQPQTVLAVDGETFGQASVSNGCGVAVDSKNNNFWFGTVYAGKVTVCAGADNKVVTNIALGFCPGSVVIDSARRVAWVDGQCGKGDDPVWAIDADTFAILAGPIRCGGINGVPLTVNPVTGRFYHNVKGHAQRIAALDFKPTDTRFGPIYAANPSNGLMYAAGPNGTLQIIDGKPNPEVLLAEVRLQAPESGSVHVCNVAVNPQLNRIYVPNAQSNTLLVLDGATGKLLQTLRVGEAMSGLQGVAVDAERDRIYAVAAMKGGGHLLYTLPPTPRTPPQILRAE